MKKKIDWWKVGFGYTAILALITLTALVVLFFVSIIQYMRG